MRFLDIQADVNPRVSGHFFRSVRVRRRWTPRYRRLPGCKRQQDDTRQHRWSYLQALFELYIHGQVQYTVVLAHIPLRTVPALFKLLFSTYSALTGKSYLHTAISFEYPSMVHNFISWTYSLYSILFTIL